MLPLKLAPVDLWHPDGELWSGNRDVDLVLLKNILNAPIHPLPLVARFNSSLSIEHHQHYRRCLVHRSNVNENRMGYWGCDSSEWEPSMQPKNK